MYEVQTRQPAPRDRVSARGGRGGYSNRGGRGGSRSSKPDSSENAAPAVEDEGEIGQMKKKYSTTLPTLRELFPDWTDEDLVFALEDSQGDLESAIERITEGNVSQWGEVKKKTADRPRAKAKEVQSTPTESTSGPVRGSRGRGGFEGRGRSRGERGGRGGRGGRAGAHPNGTRAATTDAWSTPDAGAPADAWETAPDTVAASKPVQQSWNDAAPAVSESIDDWKQISDDTPKSSIISEPPKKGWASLFAKPPPPQQKTSIAVPAPVSDKPFEQTLAQDRETVPVPVPESAPIQNVPEERTPQPAQAPGEPELTEEVAPSKDDLTEKNLERVSDESVPAQTATVASTIGSTHDLTGAVGAATPSKSSLPGYPTSAFRQAGRVAGFQRRVMEQQEAVVMPGNHALDRATVQFGSMGLNGDTADLDIDENREDTETRAQPPQHSPVAPRASLPPPTQPHPSAEPTMPRPAPGLPPIPQTSAADASFNDFTRYSDSQKAYDPFSHQVSQPQPQVHEPFANQAPTQPTGTSSSEYSPFYAVDQQRLPYNYYGSTYGQSQDPTAAQRAASGFGVSGADVQPQVPATQPPSRYGQVEAPNSGHNTPNPTLHAATQAPSAQHVPGGQGAHGGYGYGYPYYSNPHYASYMGQMNQHQYSRSRPMYDDARRYDEHYMQHTNQYGYGNQYGAPYGKGAMYGQPQHAFYEHTSSPANSGSFPGRDSMYGRTGSAQPSDMQQSPATVNAFGSGMSDVFGRTPAGFGQNQPIAQQQPVATEESAKSYETPKAGGPSPSLAQANRPGSATNSAPGQAQTQTNLPPLQGQHAQQGFSGYPHLNPQYGSSLGGLGGHQGSAAHQATAYSSYGNAGFGNYYGNSGRGGWGANYGH